MKKRIISMLLVLLMAISLLPAAAMATDIEDQNPPAHETDSLYLGKSYNPNDGMLTLETYAKGKTIITERVQPCDIVLVLDVSGSMDEYITVGSKTDTSQLDPVRGGAEGFYQARHSVYGWENLRFHNGKWQRYFDGVTSILNGWYDLEGDSLFAVTSIRTTRINAMKVAADRFIDTVQANAAENQVDHKISIVKFAGTYSSTVGNTTYRENGNTYNHSQIVKNLTTVQTTQQASELKNALTPIVEGGATRADYGMQHAKDILTAANDPERGKVVVFMTDGTPTDRTDFNSTVANSAVGYAKDLKDIGTLVYSVGIFEENPGAQINQFMNAVSSNTPSATVYTQGSTSQNAGKYYMTATTASGLEEIFKSIAEEIGGAFIDLNEESTVVDKMSSYFKLDGVSAADTSKVKVYTADCIGDGTFANPVEKTGLTVSVVDGDTVKVTGYDFSDNWVGYDESTNSYRGQKLIIKFPVQPKADAEGKVPTNSDISGVYDKDGKLVLDYPVPQYTPAEVSKVIDFNAKVNLATGVGELGDQTRKNGLFALDTGTLTYQFHHDKALSSGDVSLVMDGVDSAMTFTSNVWTKYNAIPANNIYFDDDLVSLSALTYDDGSGYNAGVTTAVSSGAAAIDDGENGKVYYFTFKGTGIDVYCTTDTDGGYVQSALVTDKENLKGSLVPNTLKAVRSYSEHTFYNTPTVFYDHLDPNTTYTLYLKVLKGANFKLDGVRVYNTMGADESVYNDNLQEKNARFVNLRENLLNDGEQITITDPTQAGLTGQEPATKLTGVLYIDDEDSLELKYEESGEMVYPNAFKAYEKNGPKNEIYLDANQSIVFQLDAPQTGDHYWLGLSAPQTGEGQVTVNNAQVPTKVTSAVDMYYDGFEVTDGSVTIKNTGTSVIAITNLKITNPTVVRTVNFNSVSPKLLMTARPGAEAAAAAETGTAQAETMSALIRQLLSSFIQQLFGSISRLFG